jgi:putative flippase GtrA
MSRELLWFGIIGVSALFVHFLLVTLLVPTGIAPLYANVIAYLVAFQVSYWGHRHKTFNAAHLSHGQTLPRFIAVSALSFALNEGLYYLLLRFTALDYRLALLLVLGLVAVVTFILSRVWAFYSAEPA